MKVIEQVVAVEAMVLVSGIQGLIAFAKLQAVEVQSGTASRLYLDRPVHRAKLVGDTFRQAGIVSEIVCTQPPVIFFIIQIWNITCLRGSRQQ